jgi:uncharacterized protein YndB with AHSA1/START domain
MWKWLSGCLVVVVLLVAIGLWRGYTMMHESLSPDGSVRVTIAASPSRVFASLANGDSAATWMARGSIVTSTRHGMLVPGDVIRVATHSVLGMPQQRLTWQVREVVPDHLLVMQFIPDTSTRIMAMRRDSLTAKGDSTVVISRVESPKLDSLRKARPDAGDSLAQPLNRVASDLLLTMIRMQPKIDLMRLKARVEKSGGSTR